MKQALLRSMTGEQLVQRFVEIALAQDQALLWDEIANFNRLYDEREQVEQELRQRDGDQRRLLLSLFDHQNAQVRLSAAIATLALAPTAAMQTLKIISDRDEYPQAANARGMMSALERGTFVPK